MRLDYINGDGVVVIKVLETLQGSNASCPCMLVHEELVPTVSEALQDEDPPIFTTSDRILYILKLMYKQGLVVNGLGEFSITKVGKAFLAEK